MTTEKKSKFGFFKKSKKTNRAESPAAAESDDGSVKSGSFARRNKSFNPFKSVRKTISKYRSVRRPEQETAAVLHEDAPPAEAAPVVIDVEKLDELREEVAIVEDIRKGRARGPQGRKRRTGRPASMAKWDGSSPDLANSCSAQSAAEKLSNDLASSVTPPTPSADIAVSDVDNLAASSEVNTEEKSEVKVEVKSEVKEKSSGLNNEIQDDALTLDNGFCKSALGTTDAV